MTVVAIAIIYINLWLLVEMKILLVYNATTVIPPDDGNGSIVISVQWKCWFIRDTWSLISRY